VNIALRYGRLITTLVENSARPTTNYVTPRGNASPEDRRQNFVAFL